MGKFGWDEFESALNHISIPDTIKRTFTRWLLEMVIPRAKETTSFEDRTGLLRTVINIVSVTETPDSIVFVVGWGTAAPYGKFQEFGTKWVLPRNFIKDATEQEMASLPGYWIVETNSEKNAIGL